jgi:hypothetical protein
MLSPRKLLQEVLFQGGWEVLQYRPILAGILAAMEFAGERRDRDLRAIDQLAGKYG